MRRLICAFVIRIWQNRFSRDVARIKVINGLVKIIMEAEWVPWNLTKSRDFPTFSNLGSGALKFGKSSTWIWKIGNMSLKMLCSVIVIAIICNKNSKVSNLNNSRFELLKWAASWQNQQCGCAPSEDSDQPGHLPSLIRVFAVRSMGSYGSKLSSCRQRRLWSDWADAQADLSLRWAHTHFVGFVTRRLKWYLMSNSSL